MSRQFMSIAMRLRSSAGFCFSQSTFGTIPNIAPPSKRKTPSLNIRTSKRPMRTRRQYGRRWISETFVTMTAQARVHQGEPHREVDRAVSGIRPAQEQFGRVAEAYVDSPNHAQGADLDRVVELAIAHGGERVVDVGTGVAHTLRRVASHVRNRTVRGWRHLAEAAGLRTSIDSETSVTKLDVDSWLARSQTPKDRADAVRHRLRDASPAVVRAFDVTATSFSVHKLILLGRK